MDVGIPGVLVRALERYSDGRGWLSELVRADDLPASVEPQMGYLSVTLPGVVRGPHEHREQTDVFCFLFGSFELRLWDRRPGASSEGRSLLVGDANPCLVVVPPGVVHAYRNLGDTDGIVLNFPDRLYRGAGKREPVDETRYEGTESPYAI